MLSFSYTSSFPRLINKGYHVGFLFHRSKLHSLTVTPTLNKLSGSAGFAGESTTFDTLNSHWYNTAPTHHSSVREEPYQTRCYFSGHKPYCNSISIHHTLLNSVLAELVKSIESKKHRDDLYTLLIRFFKVFDTSKHNITNTSINYVINIVPHSPPACKSYAQPDKEQVMYKSIHQFLQAALISESQFAVRGAYDFSYEERWFTQIRH